MYLPKSTSFSPARTDIAVKLLNLICICLFVYLGDDQNHEALPENTKDTIGKKLFLKVLSCIRVLVFESNKSQPNTYTKTTSNFLQIFYIVEPKFSSCTFIQWGLTMYEFKE
jgi:hypothetical protein